MGTRLSNEVLRSHHSVDLSQKDTKATWLIVLGDWTPEKFSSHFNRYYLTIHASVKISRNEAPLLQYPHHLLSWHLFIISQR